MAVEQLLQARTAVACRRECAAAVTNYVGCMACFIDLRVLQLPLCSVSTHSWLTGGSSSSSCCGGGTSRSSCCCVAEAAAALNRLLVLLPNKPVCDAGGAYCCCYAAL